MVSHAGIFKQLTDVNAVNGPKRYLSKETWKKIDSSGFLGGCLKILEFSLLLVRSYWNFYTICKIENKTLFVPKHFSI